MSDELKTAPRELSAGENTAIAATPGPRRRYRRRLKNLVNVRVALADVVCDLEELPPSVETARARVYALSTLAGVIEANLQPRLERVEEVAGTAKPGALRRVG